MTHTTSDFAVELDIQIHAPIDHVWRIISTPDGMRRWQGATLFEPRLGGRTVFHINLDTGSTAEQDAQYRMDGRIVAFTPPYELAYTWRQTTLATGDTWPADTLVTITLSERGPQLTRARVVHSGFEALGEALGRELAAAYRQGWEDHDDLGQLKRLAETQP